MDDDWDLHAVVKGCSAAVNTTNVSNTTAAAAANTSIENPFPRFSSMTFDDDKSTSYDFPNIIDYENPFQDLQEIYQEFCGDPPPPDIPAATIPAAQVFQPQQEQMQPSLGMNMQMQPSLGMNMQMQPSLGMNMQMQGNTDLKSFMLGSSSHNFPAMNSQPTRPRKRKNQQTKMVRQMTQEELSADSWAWRKYGQKPIKGSSHPRNYYRCSTSKGCAARKQVERSPNDPGIFIVSYSGEHTHARPSHRSSLAGSTRPKLSTTTRNNNMIINNNNNNNPLLFPKGLISSSSTFSPNTPLMEGQETAQNDDVEIVEEDGDEDDDDNNGDLFKGFHDSDDHDSSGGGGGDSLFSSGLLASPPWASTSSAVNGGGCG